jgi:hypothetical protein
MKVTTAMRGTDYAVLLHSSLFSGEFGTSNRLGTAGAILPGRVGGIPVTAGNRESHRSGFLLFFEISDLLL